MNSFFQIDFSLYFFNFFHFTFVVFHSCSIFTLSSTSVRENVLTPSLPKDLFADVMSNYLDLLLFSQKEKKKASVRLRQAIEDAERL